MKLKLIALAILASSSYASNYTVNTTDDSVDANVGDGLCETVDMNCSLRAAIQEANSNTLEKHSIYLPNGQYDLTSELRGENKAEFGDLDILSDISIYGENLNNTIIDGNSIDRVFDILETKNGSMLRLDSLTIINGMSFDTQGGSIRNNSIFSATNVSINHSQNDPNPNIGDGGALYNGESANAELTLVTISNSNANSGGAIHNEGYISITSSTFRNNMAVNGGAIATNGPTTIYDTQLESNSASGAGGAIHSSATISLSNSSLLLNSAPKGGALFTTTNGSATLNKTSLTNNNAEEGGAIYNEGDSEISSSRLRMNQSDVNAGSIYNNGELFLEHSTADNNTTQGSGGVIFNAGSSLIENSSIYANNSTLHGAAIYNEQGDTRLSSNSIVNNEGLSSTVFSINGFVNIEKSYLQSVNANLICDVAELPSEIKSLGYNLMNKDTCYSSPLDTIADEALPTLTDISILSIVTPQSASGAYGLVDGGALEDQCPKLSQNLKLRNGTDCDAGAYDTSTIDAQIGTFGFENTSITVNELQPNPNDPNENVITIPVSRTLGADGAAKLTYQTIGITANQSGSQVDYENKSGTLSWEHGDTAAKQISIAITDDENVEDEESFKIILSSPSVGDLGNREVLININDNDIRKGTFEFSTNFLELIEGETIELTMTRTEYTIGSVDVEFELVNSIGIEETNVSISNYIFSFEDGQTSQTVELFVTNNEEYGPGSTINLAMTENNNNITLGEVKELTINVLDDELQPTYGTFTAEAENNATEPSTTPVTVTRTSETGRITGIVEIRADLVKQGQIIDSTLVTFQDGELEKTFDVIVEENDSYEEPYRLTIDFNILRQEAGNEFNSDAVLATNTLNITVTDNDPIPDSGVFGFEASNVTLDAEGQSAIITVSRTGGVTGQHALNIQTELGTATTSDFTLSDTTLVFQEGENVKSFVITNVIDNKFEPSPKRLTLRLIPEDTATVISNDSLDVILRDAEENDLVLEKTGGSTGILALLLLPIWIVRKLRSK